MGLFCIPNVPDVVNAAPGLFAFYHIRTHKEFKNA